MTFPPEADASRVLDDLLHVRRVLERAEGERPPEVAAAVRLASDGQTPILMFRDVGYCHHGNGEVTEVRRVGHGLLATRLLSERGEVLRSEVGLPGFDPEAILERIERRGSSDLN